MGNTSGGAIVPQSDYAGSLARGGRLRLLFHNFQIGLGRGRELLLRRFRLLLLLLPIALARFAIFCHAVDAGGVVPILVAGACIKNGRCELRPRFGTTRLTFRGFDNNGRWTTPANRKSVPEGQTTSLRLHSTRFE
jgi:hypothetical protein